MKFSLIIGTLGRVTEVAALLESLSCQTLPPYQVFLVDQNEDDRLAAVVERYALRLPLFWLRNSAKGLSAARNIALQQATGDIIAFPDDDCCYPSNLLADLAAGFSRVETQGIIVAGTSGRSVRAGFLTRYSIWIVGVSYRIFLKQSVVKQVGLFDETLGVGAGTPYGSGEETDYLIRCLHYGNRLYYDPSLIVQHPAVDFSAAAVSIKAYQYALGRRQVLLRYGYPWWYRWLDGIWPLLRLVASLHMPGKVRYYWNQFLGRTGAFFRAG